jgi:hypothetical protein
MYVHYKFLATFPSFFQAGDPINSLVEKSSVAEPTIIIVFNEENQALQFMSIIEKEIYFITKTDGKSFLAVLIALMGCYYVFWLSFPKCHAGILYYLFDRVFKLSDEFAGPKRSLRYTCFLRELAALQLQESMCDTEIDSESSLSNSENPEKDRPTTN